MNMSHGKSDALQPLLLIFVLSFSIILINIPQAYGHAAVAADHGSVKIINQLSFRGLDGKINLIGEVQNPRSVPVEVELGLNVLAKDHISSLFLTAIKEATYGRIIYPSAVSPFKFTVGSDKSVIGDPYIVNIKEVSLPRYDNIVFLNYSNVPRPADGAFIGTVKNTGPFDLHNVTVYASVHGINGTQIDSVKSNAFPLLKPGEELPFIARPDGALRSKILYFSCAAFDINPKMNTLDTGKGHFISYDLQGAVAISDLRYDTKTDSMVFDVRHYDQHGGPLNLKVIKVSQNHPVSVIMDGQLDKKASIRVDGKMVHIDIFVPSLSPSTSSPSSSYHNVQIKGI
jgi:hypothetical protein